MSLFIVSLDCRDSDLANVHFRHFFYKMVYDGAQTADKA
jgi:hypothetical protein